ncbi:hypothetical protein BDM02DRAFT_3120313 [Thelephora ganbajun]|uniref:Uncharacterized protein n=1 Tax=Thelephora ganbajun TaxID=370292 RepID=A0ACB6Z6J9_THEGA|nr:hypothetical protein BDM02DRAFT_3120313 [Thelephora ganbajun]
MLDFNLKKPDRAALHKRIVSSVITPVALAHMSSTDLASEAEKESIKQAEQEALEHSILQKTVAPRAKVTHKGLQDIEDIDGRPAARDLDLDKEMEEEERRERERTARMRMRSATLTSGSGSVPPESPTVPDHPSSVGWGGPPPIPFHLQQSPISPLATDRPLFAQTQSELLTPANGQVEGELNLADLINIDDDGHDSVMVVDTSPAPAVAGIDTEDGPETLTAGIPQSPVVSQSARPTGISPFAVNTSQPDLTIRPSFDLNSVWSAPVPSPKKENEEAIGGPEKSGEPVEPPPDLGKELELKDPFVDDDILGGAAADDKDFDMFLEADPDADSLEGRSASANPPPDAPVKEPSFDELPQVWLGSLSMPLESNTPTEIPVLARQMGGRPLEHDSPLWNTLFPSVQLRIDGRVPIDKSAQFLLQMRMNSSKELIAVAFSSPSEQQNGSFKLLIDYLLGKNRHGLVFPWGTKPKEHHPGRELYIIPLLSSDPLPDYVELLDSLRLPKTRTEDYLIGAWILNKGKLAAPPAPTPPPPPPTLSTNTPGLASIISQLQQTATNPSFGVPPPPSISPPSIPSVPPIAPPPVSESPINPAALAAEVASLTPDQIQRMLQSLTQVGPGQIPPPIPQRSPPPIPPSSNGHGPPPWMNGLPPPGPPGMYPPFPPNIGQHQPSGQGPSPPPLHPHQQPPYHSSGPPSPHRPPYPGGPGGPYENQDQSDGPGYERSRYERGYGPPPRGGRGRSESGGWRGRGGGRDRDRGRDRERGDRPRDSGWPKRGGRGGPGWGERSRT